MIVVEAASLAVGDVILPFGRRKRPAGVVLVEPVGGRVRLALRGGWLNEDPKVERLTVSSRRRFQIATDLPTYTAGMRLYRRGVGKRLVAWYPVFK